MISLLRKLCLLSPFLLRLSQCHLVQVFSLKALYMFSLSFSRRLILNSLWRSQYYILLLLLSLLWLAHPVSVNAQATWCRYFDFTISQQGWSGYGSGGDYAVYVASEGWRRGNNAARFVVISPVFSATLLQVEAEYSHAYTPTNGTAAQTVFRNSPNTLIIDVASYPTAFDSFDLAVSPAALFSGTYVRVGYSANSSSSTSPAIDNTIRLQSITLWGSGSIPFTAGVDCFPTPTPTPTLESTATPTLTPIPSPTLPSGFGIGSLCPLSLVDPSTVSASYQMSCQPCLSAYQTPVPYTGEGTLTPSPTPLGYVTTTPHPNTGTYEPPPTELPDTTPEPVTLTCNFAQTCGFLSVPIGNVGAFGIEHVDLPAEGEYEGEYWRYVSIILSIPKSSNGIPLSSNIVIDFEIDAYIDDNVYVETLSQYGARVALLNFSYDGVALEFNTTVNQDTPNVSYVVISFLSDIDVSSLENLDGSVLVEFVELTYQPIDNETSNTGLLCYLPDNYPAVAAFDISFGGYSNTTCHTIIPFVDMTLLSDVLQGFGWDIGNWFIPRFDVCIDWYVLPSITLFGLVVPFTFLINAYLLKRLLSWIIKF